MNGSLDGRKNVNSPPRDLELLEQAICEAAESEFSLEIRRAESAPKSKEHIAAIKNNIEREAFQRQSVLVTSLNNEVDYYLLPLIKTLIQIETDLRVKNRLPFSEARMATLREILRNLVMKNWSDLVWSAYRDSVEHVVKHLGCVFDYIEEELKKRRAELQERTPNRLFDLIDELLKKASADSKIAASM